MFTIQINECNTLAFPLYHLIANNTAISTDMFISLLHISGQSLTSFLNANNTAKLIMLPHVNIYDTCDSQRVSCTFKMSKKKKNPFAALPVSLNKNINIAHMLISNFSAIIKSSPD